MFSVVLCRCDHVLYYTILNYIIALMRSKAVRQQSLVIKTCHHFLKFEIKD